jgi:hypothetical protein
LAGTKVHKSLNGLLSLRSLWLELVVRSVDQLSVGADELTKLGEIDVNKVGLREELTNDLEDVSKDCLESAFFYLAHLGHGGVGWLGLDFENYSSEIGVFRLVVKTMGLHEVVRESDKWDP